jgi:hypothetical protein
MQQDGETRKYSLLRKIGAWALVPGLGVPATKFVEGYYDVKFFSPVISGLWQWIQDVGKALQGGCQFGFDEVRETSGLSRIATQNALDHLYRVGPVSPTRGAYGYSYADLTPLVREHDESLTYANKGSSKWLWPDHRNFGLYAAARCGVFCFVAFRLKPVSLQRAWNQRATT